MPSFQWRPLEAADLPQVERIAAAVHPGFFEEPSVFADRLALYPAGVQLLEIAGDPQGYVLAHPWRLGELPALNTVLGTPIADADTFYIHDLALLPAARGTGAAAAIVAGLIEHARAVGFPSVSLVAVNGSVPFWGRHGFAVVDRPDLDAKLLSYEAAAAFMVRRLERSPI